MSYILGVTGQTRTVPRPWHTGFGKAARTGRVITSAR